MRAVSVSSLWIALSLTTALPALSAQKLTSPIALGCPVDFSLQRNGSGMLSAASGPERPSAEKMKRSVQVSLRSLQGRAIMAAEITLYAQRISNNATPAMVVYGQTNEADLITRTYHVVQGTFATGLLTGNLDLVDSMAGVERAEIKSVTYADGTTWRAAYGARCSATPSIFMLIAQP